MGIRAKIEIGVAVFFAAILFVCAGQQKRIHELTCERDRYRANTETLLTDVKQFKLRDSLSAARVQTLELTVKEFEKFRAEDAALVKQLKGRNRDLVEVNKTQAETILKLRAIPKDTVLIRDTLKIPAIKVSCGDAWFDFNGLLTETEFTGELHNRDSLLLAETVRYKRFLGFLWKTKEVKERNLSVVSRNPHTEIIGVEHIVVEK